MLSTAKDDEVHVIKYHVAEWAAKCNLNPNQKKIHEMLIRRAHVCPLQFLGITRTPQGQEHGNPVGGHD